MGDHAKSRGRSRSLTQMKEFMKMAFNANLIDLGCYGQNFTWSNRRFTEVLIKERINRGFGSNLWLSTFPDSHIEHC